MTDSIVYLHSHSASSPKENICTDEKCPAFNIDQKIKEQFDSYMEQEKQESQETEYTDAYQPFCELAENIRKFAAVLAKEVGEELSGAKDEVARETKNAAKDLARELKNAASEVKHAMKEHEKTRADKSKRAKRATRFGHPHFPFPPPPPHGSDVPSLPRFTEAEIADLIDQGATVEIHESDDGKSRKIVISF
ncbi:hypothetical protein HDV06_007130 [Boothiomyces sp. JEL0866]|nr:hypothetical protein HDV06_007130 [Boothiomyces sp. JEL0866]